MLTASLRESLVESGLQMAHFSHILPATGTKASGYYYYLGVVNNIFAMLLWQMTMPLKQFGFWGEWGDWVNTTTSLYMYRT